MTQEHIEKLQRETKEQQEALKILEATSTTSIWLSDLEKLETAIKTDTAFTDAPLTMGSKIKLPPIVVAKSPSAAKKSSKGKSTRSQKMQPSKRQKLIKLNPEDSL